MGLFNLGNFVLHSGEESHFKIDCDALTDDDIAAVADILASMLPPFAEVYGIPRGGRRLADAIRRYTTTEGRGTLLIVDDVLTTGRSMQEERARRIINRRVIGAVIFARTTLIPSWITPLFIMEGV